MPNKFAPSFEVTGSILIVDFDAPNRMVVLREHLTGEHTPSGTPYMDRSLIIAASSNDNEKPSIYHPLISTALQDGVLLQNTVTIRCEDPEVNIAPTRVKYDTDFTVAEAWQGHGALLNAALALGGKLASWAVATKVYAQFDEELLRLQHTIEEVVETESYKFNKAGC